MGVFADQLNDQLEFERGDYLSDKAYQRMKESGRDPRTDGTTKPRLVSVHEGLWNDGTGDDVALARDPRAENVPPKSGIRWTRVFVTLAIVGGVFYIYKRWA